MAQYLQMFIEESKDHLQNLNDNLLKLEKDPTDSEIINEIFRSAHTLKGMSGTMGFVNTQKLTHTMENLLSEIREGNIQANTDIVDILFKSLDALENYIDEVVNTGSEGEKKYDDIITSLGNMLKSKGQITPGSNIVNEKNEEEMNKIDLKDEEKDYLNQAKEDGSNVYEVSVELNETCLLKAARAFLVIKNIQENGELYKSVPSIQDLEDEKFEYDMQFVVITEYSQEKIQDMLEAIAEVKDVKISEYTIPMDTQKDESVEVKSEKATDKNVAETKKAESMKKEEIAKNSTDKKVVSTKTVRVDINRLDNLMNLVSELIIVKTRLDEGIRGGENTETLEYLDRVTNSLHDAVMKVRMVPIERVFNRFPRMIRDLSKSLNKNIDLNMSGEETELDRTVIDEIGDPLIHLLRNAADHGLETPEERANAGKDKKGTIKLVAYQDGNNVVIEVSDDGKGIDYEIIKQKAIEKGIISLEVASTLSENEASQLMFAPSFSTAEKITNVSGRGVGLDVVKTKIEALGGNVEVKSKLGEGTKFIVRLPLTLAIIQSLMVNVGAEKYAIPLNIIQTIEDIKIDEIQHIQKRETIVLRNKVIPLVRLDRELDINKENQGEKQELTVVIVKKGEKEAGFVIDSLIGEQEIVIKSLGKYLSNIKMIAGATILGNGEVALILDLNTLI